MSSCVVWITQSVFGLTVHCLPEINLAACVSTACIICRLGTCLRVCDTVHVHVHEVHTRWGLHSHYRLPLSLFFYGWTYL